MPLLKKHHYFRVHPIPYYDDGINVRKFVIDQGADIVLTDFDLNEFNNNKTFESLVELTTGENQANWCLNTGYYPTSKSASNSAIYQEFLNEATPAGIQNYMSKNDCSESEAKQHAYSSQTRVAYREGANVNQNEYMNLMKNWIKFEDAPFIGSDNVRLFVKQIFRQVFISLNNDAQDSEYEEIIDAISEDESIKYSPNIVIEH